MRVERPIACARRRSRPSLPHHIPHTPTTPTLTHRMCRLHGHPPRPHIRQQGPRVRVAAPRNQAAQQFGRPPRARPRPIDLPAPQATAELCDVGPKGGIGHYWRVCGAV